MNVRILIDGIVRQTMVLIAQLATSGGLRAPLAHVAGQVFLELSKELENQGLTKKVTADMFGMALRTYQRRTHRLSQSVTDRGRSLAGGNERRPGGKLAHDITMEEELDGSAHLRSV